MMRAAPVASVASASSMPGEQAGECADHRRRHLVERDPLRARCHLADRVGERLHAFGELEQQRTVHLLGRDVVGDAFGKAGPHERRVAVRGDDHHDRLVVHAHGVVRRLADPRVLLIRRTDQHDRVESVRRHRVPQPRPTLAAHAGEVDGGRFPQRT